MKIKRPLNTTTNVSFQKMSSFWKIVLILFIGLVKACLANLPPLFVEDMSNQVIPENTPIGTVIYKLEASDPENGTVHYDLQGTDLLKVNHETGEITVIKTLDYETNTTLNLIVSAEDQVEGGGKNNIVEVPITVIISDENDNAPEFLDAPYDLIVNEDALPGSKIFPNITVIDKDTSGSNIEVDCETLPIYPDACDVFTIEADTSEQNLFQGAIVLHKKLNYSEQQVYEFILKATDGELSSKTGVSIKIGDVQDTPPHFIGNMSAEIDEDAVINTLVLTAHAEDGDYGIPRKIVYTLEQNPMDYFLLDTVSGELRTARPLDKESIDNSEGILKFKIRAHELVDGIKSNDPLSTATEEVIVKIKDVNDEPPKFNNRDYFVEIPENIQEGSALPGLDMFVKDPDEGNNSAFSLELNDISEVFSIEPSTAVGSTPVTIRVANNSLDYEDPNKRKFIILAVARELHSREKLSSTATITVSVTDINDNAPTFDQESYSATISELALPGTSVITILAKDRDSGKFGENGIIYKLGGNGANKFTVNNKTGFVTVAFCEEIGKPKCLDFESQAEYQLQFIATDDDGKGQTTTVPLKVSLTDSNDNPPVFSQSIYRAFVNEGSVKFDPELFVEAVDADKTSHVTYSIVSGNEEGVFGIDKETGKLKIMSTDGLDVKNDTDNVISFEVMASDGKFSATASVNITILDINNNMPIFSKESYVDSIPEDIPVGSSVIQVHATDADNGENAVVEYFMQKGGYDDFSIDNNTGVVYVLSKLDFDRRNTYNMEIIALDHGVPSLTGTTTFTVNVINTNDKLPYFVPTTQTASVMEDVPVGTIIYTLIALDPDVNSSEALNFAATEPITALDKHGNEVVSSDAFKEFFSIDKNSGRVSVINPLVRDYAAVVRITILVTDITAPTVQQGQGLLEIVIDDVNDSPPTFLPPWTVENPIYYLDLKEEQPVGTIVATYKAIDEDSDIAGYNIIPANEYFQINNGTGIVQIKKTIDYEILKELNFTVMAFDSGIPQLNASALVIVKIINLNDNEPKFSIKEYNVSIEENVPNNTFVVAVKATDNDSEEYGEIVYSLTGQNSEHFYIDNKTGYVTVANSKFLDHEKINETVIQAVATDSAPNQLKRSVSVPIYIKIKDVNDNAPKFSQKEYNITVMENIRLNPPMPLLQVNATDEDPGINGNIHYSIVSGNQNDLFLLGVETGTLYPHKPLVGQTGEYSIVVEARDGAGRGDLYDRTLVNIQVLNVNDHAPEFINPPKTNATLEILENVAIANHLIMTLKALDKDEGENGRVTYHFKVDNKNIQETSEFSIDENTGELRSRQTLDRELKSRYQLVLVARDHGSPKWLETTSSLQILLVDENDNKPEFPQTNFTKPYQFYVTENNYRGQLIGQVKASDRDEGRHASIYYYLVAGNEDGSFNLDRSDGTLYANKSFDREKNEEYNLLIIANNDPNFFPSAEDLELNDTDRSKAQIKVTVKDLNDNEPVFEHSIYYAAVSATSEVNTFVINVTAKDLDAGLNGSLTYYIKASNLFKFGSNRSTGSIIPSPFNISHVGGIYTAIHLLENNQHRFIIEVVARENAHPEREAKTKVFVWIFEAEQLIRVILSRPNEEVSKERNEIISELSNATKSLVIVHDMRHHIDDDGRANQEWTDLFILSVNPKTQTIIPVPEVLKVIDSKYDFLKDYYAGFAIENVLPAYAIEEEESFDPALVALIALLIVLFVGIIAFIIICCCLRHWVLSPTDLKKKDALIKKAIIDDLNTTENPLWIEQKLKIYEEQELTMQVFNEPEQNVGVARRGSDEYIPDDNTYATIQHPLRRSSSHLATMSLGDDLADYATLSGVQRHQNNSNNSSLRGAPNYYEAAMGFQGSTFQVPDKLGSSNDYDPYGATFEGSQLTINHDGQPEYVAELI